MITAAFQNNVHKLLRLCSISLATFALLDFGQPSHGQSLRQAYESNITRKAVSYEQYQKELKQKAGTLKEAQYGMVNPMPDATMEYNRVSLVDTYYNLALKLENDAVYMFDFSKDTKINFSKDTKTGWQKIGPFNKTFQLKHSLVQYTKESGKLCRYSRGISVAPYSMDKVYGEITKNCYDRLSSSQVEWIVSSFLYQSPSEKVRQKTYWRF